MKKFREFFNLTKKYEFDIGDITAFMYTICAIGCILGYNMTILFAIAATIGVAFCWQARRINLVILNVALWAMNIFNLIKMIWA